jgi:glycosyltransferase involved in cell wall biosynthesis
MRANTTSRDSGSLNMKYLKNKTWLILAHSFNMDGRAVSQTITDRMPLLMQNGITPLVISAPTGSKDKNFVHSRVLSPAPSGIRFEMRYIIKNKFSDKFVSQFLKALVAIICLPFYALEKIFINLDSHWSWFISASVKGIFFVRKYKPDLIYSTAGPSSTHVAGFILSRLFDIPWICEIHDPLLYDHEKPVYQRYSFHKFLEKLIFNNACAVIFFTEKARKKAENRTHIKNKAHVLRPGANPPEIQDISYKKRQKIHFGHFGVLATGRNLVSFMCALFSLFKERPELRDKICLDIYGDNLDSVSGRALNKYSLHDVVNQHGRLEFDQTSGKSGRERVIESMHLCDVLLLLHGEKREACQEYVPSKLYEYLLTKRPVLGIVSKDSELDIILTDNGHPVVYNNNDTGRLKQVINDFAVQWETEQGVREHEKGSPFTMENTVNSLLEIAESCITK